MLNRLYNWYGKRVVWGAVLLVVALVAIGFSFSVINFDTLEDTKEQETKGVRLRTVAELSSGSSIELIGTVDAVSRAYIQSEVSGRVTGVHVKLGDQVKAGTIIGELENASERAAVLQAEGSYEAAIASAAQSDVSVSEAETNLLSTQASGINTYRSAFSTVDDVVRNLVDELYANADSGIIGFRLESLNMTHELNERRIALRDVLDTWSTKVFNNDQEDAQPLLDEAMQDTLLVAELVKKLSLVVADEKNEGATVEGNTIESYQTRFNTARSSINQTLQSIENADRAIASAEEVLSRAKLSGTETTVSSANAQVKQALGSLRAAQARLEQTVFRAPISGTVNELTIKQGDFVGSFERIATIANNGAFLLTTYISESDRGRIAVGDEARIDDKNSGTVSNIAPAIDPNTKKIEVQIELSGTSLSNGDTLRAVVAPSDDKQEIDKIVIPVSALKVETDRIVVFTVSSQNTLVAHEIETGPLVGSNIVVESGLTPSMNIVADARGLNEGDGVHIID